MKKTNISRRGFIKSAAAAGSLSLMGATSTKAISSPVKSNPSHRAAIITSKWDENGNPMQGEMSWGIIVMDMDSGNSERYRQALRIKGWEAPQDMARKLRRLADFCEHYATDPRAIRCDDQLTGNELLDT